MVMGVELCTFCKFIWLQHYLLDIIFSLQLSVL